MNTTKCSLAELSCHGSPVLRHVRQRSLSCGKVTSWSQCDGKGQWPWATAGEQSLSGWGDVMLCSSCCCPERIAVVWPAEGNGLCCCCPLAGCTGAPAPAQDLLVGFCGRVVSVRSRNGAARSAAKGSKQAWEEEVGRGWISRTEGKEPRTLCIPDWCASPWIGSLLPWWGGRTGVIWKRYEAVWLVSGMVKRCQNKRQGGEKSLLRPW